MPAPSNPRLTVLRQWVEKAEHDLTAAAQIQKLGKSAPTDTVCFHAQQCVEKYLKAVLVDQGIPFAKTHDIEVLVKLIPPQHRPTMTPTEQKLFTSFSVVVRYPQAGLAIPLRESRSAVALARRIRREVRRSLPRSAVKRSK
jgi:HEPN domain-containing protein